VAVRIYQVDAFAEGPFAGNPAAVCLLPASPAREDVWMQAVAAEMNLSETAFLVERGDGWGLRWFTPQTEVDLCGHATLAGAHVLFREEGRPAGEPLRFHTRSGVLVAELRGEAIELDFPATPAEPAEPPAELLAAVGARPVASGRSRFDWLLEVASEQEVRELSPDFAALRRIETRGIMVTARAPAGSEYDFVSRFFAPHEGVDEDPVTGSAHCCLAPWWGAKLGRQEMTGYQASRRGGLVRVRLAGDRVRLGGRAVTVLRGELSAEAGG
jgi:PhzF family phenazine biosynthesis protein